MEAEFLAELANRARCAPPHPAVRIGIGDDAAVLRAMTDEPVITVDMLMDGTDFHADRLEPSWIGRKSLAVNLSDLAAMAARPVAAFVAVALPKSGIPYHHTLQRPVPVEELAREILAGITLLANEFGVAIAGGDTNTWDAPLAISVTMIGESTPDGVLRRDGARPGDAILVTGSLGGSILSHHVDFTPRVRESLHLNARYQIHAAIDISDGLSLDLSRLASASGVGAIVDTRSIPISDDARRLAESERLLHPQEKCRSPLEHALGDGEDFELILAVPPDEAKRILCDHAAQDSPRLTWIGTFCNEPGLWHCNGATHSLVPLTPDGWLH